jgi:hypothetical protein
MIVRALAGVEQAPKSRLQFCYAPDRRKMLTWGNMLRYFALVYTIAATRSHACPTSLENRPDRGAWSGRRIRVIVIR